MFKSLISLWILAFLGTGFFVNQSYPKIATNDKEVLAEQTNSTKPIESITNPNTNKDATKFILQSKSGFCPRSAEGCWESSLIITQDTTVYQNNKKICSSKTQDQNWKKLKTSFEAENIEWIIIPKLCSSCFDGAEMTLTISSQNKEYSIDFDSARRFDFDANNTSHSQFKQWIETVGRLWSGAMQKTGDMTCSENQLPTVK